MTKQGSLLDATIVVSQCPAKGGSSHREEHVAEILAEVLLEQLVLCRPAKGRCDRVLKLRVVRVRQGRRESAGELSCALARLVLFQEHCETDAC